VAHNIFFTADTHWGHARIVQLCDRRIVGSDGELRQFKHVDEMDEVMIQRWNERIGPKDIVYHLGDFNYKSNAGKYFHRLNGAQKFLLVGNHDSADTYKQPWSHVYGKKHEYVALKRQFDGQDVVLAHFAQRVWHSSCHGVWHLYGHSHDKLPPNGLSFDVGVDGHDFYPWEWSEIKDKIATLDYKNHPEAHILKKKLG